MNKLKFTVTLAAATMAIDANAATVTYWSPSSGPTTLQQFDPTLGTLNSAQVYTYYYFQNRYAFPGSNMTPMPEIRLKGTIGDPSFGQITFDFYGSGLRDNDQHVSVYFSRDKWTLFTGDVSRFVGTALLSVPVPINFDYLPDAHFDKLLRTDTLSGAGVIYNFTPFATAVPEPTTWAMMLVGLGMVAGAARYRRRTTKVAYA